MSERCNENFDIKKMKSVQPILPMRSPLQTSLDCHTILLLPSLQRYACNVLWNPLEDSRAANNSIAMIGEPKHFLWSSYLILLLTVTLIRISSPNLEGWAISLCIYFNFHWHWSTETGQPIKHLIPQPSSHGDGVDEKIKRSRKVTHFHNSFRGSVSFPNSHQHTAVAWVLMLCYRFSIHLPHSRRERAPVWFIPGCPPSTNWEE